MKFLAPLAASGLLLTATAGFAQMTPGSDPSVPTAPGTTAPAPMPGPANPSTMPPTAPTDPTTGAGMPNSTPNGSTTTTTGDTMTDPARPDTDKKKRSTETPD